MIGLKNMDFSAFDTKKLDEYCARAKELWAETPEMREYERAQRGARRRTSKSSPTRSCICSWNSGR